MVVPCVIRFDQRSPVFSVVLPPNPVGSWLLQPHLANLIATLPYIFFNKFVSISHPLFSPFPVLFVGLFVTKYPHRL